MTGTDAVVKQVSAEGVRLDQRMPSPPTIAPVLVADLLAEGEPMPLYVHVIDHPDARVLIDRHDGAAPGVG